MWVECVCLGRNLAFKTLQFSHVSHFGFENKTPHCRAFENPLKWHLNKDFVCSKRKKKWQTMAENLISHCLLQQAVSDRKAACLPLITLTVWNAWLHCPLRAHSSSSWRRCFSWNGPPSSDLWMWNRRMGCALTSVAGNAVIVGCSLEWFQRITELIIGVLWWYEGQQRVGFEQTMSRREEGDKQWRCLQLFLLLCCSHS